MRWRFTVHMTTQRDERDVPLDTLAMRLVIARVYAGHHNAASAAHACGIVRQTWASWERGVPMRHQDALIPMIADKLHVDEEWLRHGGALKTPGGDGPDGGGSLTEQYADHARLFVHLRPDLALTA